MTFARVMFLFFAACLLTLACYGGTGPLTVFAVLVCMACMGLCLPGLTKRKQ